MGASLKSTRLTRAPFLTSLHTKTHTHTYIRWNSSAGSRFETHNTGLFFFCYNILRLTSFPTFSRFSPPHSPPIWNYHLFSELSASQVSAAMCRTHHKQRGPVETGWVLVWAMWWVSEWMKDTFYYLTMLSECLTLYLFITHLIHCALDWFTLIISLKNAGLKSDFFYTYPYIFNYLWLDLHLFASTFPTFPEKKSNNCFCVYMKGELFYLDWH